MGKAKKQSSKPSSAWMPFCKGVLLSLGVYLLGQLLLAGLLVKGALGEGTAFPIIACLCVLAAALGGLLPARRSPWGPLPGGLLCAALFAGLLVAGGALWWEGITWTGRGGVLLLCALGGGGLAGVLGAQGRRSKKRRR